MQKDEVNIGHVQLCQRCFDSLICGILAFCILYPYLCGDEKFFPCGQSVRNRPLYAFADRFLIHVGRCRIEQPVAGLDRVINNLFALRRIRNPEYAKSLKRHFCSCVQC